MEKKERKITKPLSIYCVLVFVLFLGSFTANAQATTITGKVISTDGMGVPGANVIQKGSKNGVMTNMDGEYSIKLVPGSKTLIISYIGYATKEVSVGNKSVINVLLQSDSKELDEVVVIGYGTAKKRDVLGSMGTIKAAQIVEATPVDALDALQGQVAGVNILSNGGPGASSEITIRGLSTFNAGVAPLFVVDGQQMDNIDNIDPSSIASMEVLKDGASAAIYGSKSANGVVLITTKSGKSANAKVEFNYTTKYSFITSKIPVSNTKQKNRWAFLRAGGVANDSLGIRSQFVVDVQDLMYQAALSTQANVAVTGGNDNAKYYWNTALLNETGVMIGTSYKRINSNLKLDINLSKKFTIGTRTNFSYGITQGLDEQRALREATYRTPDVAIFDYDGSYILEQNAISNPIAIALEATRENRKFNLSSFNYIEWAFTPDLKFKATLAANYFDGRINNFNPLVVLNAQTGKINGEQRDQLSYDIQQENYLTYNKKFGRNHTVSGLIGMSNQFWKTENARFFATEFNNDYIETFYNTKTFDLSRTGTNKSGHSLSSFFARATYDYRGKYLLAGTFRRDGSSRFGSDTKWGDFPSVSAGWRISNENFMKNILPSTVSELKFRASYAVTGNERIGDYDALLLYIPGYFYNGLNGIAPSKEMGNKELGWESTKSVNYGVDLSMFKRRLNVTFDMYTKTTDGLLYDVPVPQETGFTSVKYNVGSVENKGYEIEIKGTPLVGKDFRWTSSFNIAFNENVVKSLANPAGFYSGQYKIEAGQPIGNMVGFVNQGVYQYDQSNAYATIDGKNVQLTPNFNGTTFVNYTLNGEEYTGPVKQKKYGAVVLKGGDINWEDLDGDLVIDAQNDRKVVGNGLPKYTGGFYNKLDYKNFSLAFLFNFNLGNDIYQYYDYYRNRSINSIHVPAPYRIEGAWTQQGDIAEYASEQNRAQNAPSLDSKYVKQGDYIRLKFIRLGYSLDKETIKKINFLTALNFTLSVNNVVTFTNYEGYNPELSNNGNNLQPGWDALRYPNKSDFIFGLSAQF